jgi:chemotaxis protein CheZ
MTAGGARDMAVETVINDQIMTTAERLLSEMRSGNEEQAVRTLDELVKARELSLFQELGKLTREFHDALNSFRVDSRIAQITETEIPDARERLNHVITMTQNAADKTLTAVEQSLPVCEGLCNEAQSLNEQWKKFQNRELNAQQFRDLARLIETFLGSAEQKSSLLRANLTQVLMAQDFQDLTGQVIKRVIKLVEDVEENLVNLIRISSQKVTPTADTHITKLSDIAPEGPQVPGVKTGNAVSGQDEVDDLLSSLGF